MTAVRETRASIKPHACRPVVVPRCPGTTPPASRRVPVTLHVLSGRAAALSGAQCPPCRTWRWRLPATGHRCPARAGLQPSSLVRFVSLPHSMRRRAPRDIESSSGRQTRFSALSALGVLAASAGPGLTRLEGRPATTPEAQGCCGGLPCRDPQYSNLNPLYISFFW